MRRRLFPSIFALVATAVFSPEAQAGKYDLDLTSLGNVDDAGQVTPRRDQFRSLSSELGVVVAPKPMDPADSLGLSGFALSADITLNTITSDADYWVDTAAGSPDKILPTVQIMGRKGLWPGLEVGAGASHVFDSKMWTMAGYGKLALHEGFHHLPIPSIAIRGMFSQLLGSKDFKMTTASIGGAISHVFGMGSTVNITPYAGYQALIIMSRTGVIDSTPGVDEYAGETQPCGNGDPDCTVAGEFVMERQTIIRHRPYLGFRLIFAVIRVGFEAMIVPKGGHSQEIEGETLTDTAGLQQQYTFSLGLDF
jgi:hypothetical protein